MAIPAFKRLVRFVPKRDASRICIGEPVDESMDVGLSLRQGKSVSACVWSGSSVLRPGNKTEQHEVIGRILSPVAAHEVGSIRCIGLNYVQHAKELNVDLPTVPTVFLKPSTALADPWPTPTVLPTVTQQSNTGDYESELAIILGKECKNVSEEEAMDYVLGYTACNDVSSRASQFAQTQWCFSKGFDGSCPLGPVIVSKSLVPDLSALHIRGTLNDEVMQDSSVGDLIFSANKLISFLSQSTTLQAGTVIITGTPAGVGTGRNPRISVEDGDEFAVEIQPHIGTLFSVFENERLGSI